jgi:hypothetical protein
MQFFKAKRLGRLQQELGLGSDMRVFLQIMTGGATGAFLWDLENGNTFLLISSQEIIRGNNQVPDRLTQIFTASDEELKNRWLAMQDWDDERESIMSELAARNIAVQEFEEVSKSAGAA